MLTFFYRKNIKTDPNTEFVTAHTSLLLSHILHKRKISLKKTCEMKKKTFNFTEFSFILIKKKLVKSISRNFCLQHGRKIFEDDVYCNNFLINIVWTTKKFFHRLKKGRTWKKKLGFFGASRIHSTTSCKMSKNYLIIFM